MYFNIVILNVQLTPAYSLPIPLQKQKVSNSYPSEFGLVKRFWHYILDRQVYSIPNLKIYMLLSQRENLSDDMFGCHMIGYIWRNLVGFLSK